MADDDLAARVRRLEDIEAIRALKHLYCRYCDTGYQPEPIAALFTADGVWDAGEGFGRYEGPAAIAAFFRTMPSAISFAAHLVLNEEIEVTGDTATARWRSIIPATMITPEGGVPHWMFTGYEDEYRREEGVWKVTLMRSIIHRVAPHREGWE